MCFTFYAIYHGIRHPPINILNVNHALIHETRPSRKEIAHVTVIFRQVRAGADR